MKSVLIIGGGAGGISAALKAADNGHRVILAESLPRLGGRLGSFTDRQNGYTFDYGEHLILQSYTHTLELLERLDCRDKVTIQKQLNIPFYHPEKGFFRFKTSSLKTPLNFLSALSGYRFLEFKDRIRLAKRLKRLIDNDELPAITAGEYLADASPEEVDLFWKPVILSAINGLPEDADIRLVRTAFREGFLRKGGLGFFDLPQAEIFNLRALSKMTDAGIEIRLKTPVVNLRFGPKKITAFTAHGEEISADCLIFAVPPDKLMRIIDYDPSKIGLNGDDLKFRYSDICNIHIVFQEEIFKSDHGCLLDTLPQWFFRSRYNDGNGCGYSFTISAADRFLNYGEEILDLCLIDLKKLGARIEGNEILFSKVVLSRRATIIIDPDTNDRRIGSDTGFDNVSLAGDWTNTGLPATIESAVKSGFAAAELI